MIPVTQTVTGPRGNCMAACWASILEVPIEEVPDYQAVDAAGGSWMNVINTWLSKHHDVLYVEIQPWISPALIPRGWHLINGDSPREGVGGHSCVGYWGHLVWDPHPSRTGIRRFDNYGILVPIDAERRATWKRHWSECLCGICMGTTQGDRSVILLPATGG